MEVNSRLHGSELAADLQFLKHSILFIVVILVGDYERFDSIAAKRSEVI